MRAATMSNLAKGALAGVILVALAASGARAADVRHDRREVRREHRELRLDRREHRRDHRHPFFARRHLRHDLRFHRHAEARRGRALRRWKLHREGVR